MELFDFAIGAVLGIAASGIFFAALALSVRLAARSAKPGAVILGSAVLRITLLLAAGWGAADFGLWSGIGFAVAFVLVRYVAISLARSGPMQEGV
ncbi:MAG: N-ATPase subunit AtpR [Alphaproteobacteria bacterium]